MDPQLSIDSLLTAARLLEKNGQFLGLNPLTLSFPSLVFPTPLPQPTTTVDQPVVLPSPTPLKMRQERKCSASTSAMPYSTPTRKPSTKHSRYVHIIFHSIHIDFYRLFRRSHFDPSMIHPFLTEPPTTNSRKLDERTCVNVWRNFNNSYHQCLTPRETLRWLCLRELAITSK